MHSLFCKDSQITVHAHTPKNHFCENFFLKTVGKLLDQELGKRSGKMGFCVEISEARKNFIKFPLFGQQNLNHLFYKREGGKEGGRDEQGCPMISI